jgi:hypothetical protein
MPTIVKLGNIAIRMFAKDHNPPHFHVVTPDHQALVSIETLELMRGSMDPAKLGDSARMGGREPRNS